ncbi:MAG TPA: DoxX family protein [Cytophagaceae bacterium]|nr:DoxX family protein [Cytophagaceae bacterium]
MNIVLIIIQGLLVFIFLMAGFFKLIQTKEKIVTGGGAWAADFATTHIKIIGALEVLLSVGLSLSLFLSVPPVLALVSSAGMGVVMLAAAFVHIKRKEYGLLALTLVVSFIAFFLTYQSCFSICQ